MADEKTKEEEVKTTEESVESEASQAESPEVDTEEQESAETESQENSEEATTENNASQDLELQNKYMRLHAEFENYRRRTAREILDTASRAKSELLAQLCDVVDNFDRAFSDEHKGDDLETFSKGMELIKNQLDGILKDNGLEEIAAEGAAFDPNLHEAMVKQPSADVPEDHILTVFQKGYTVNEKVIRHAKVIVSAGEA